MASLSQALKRYIDILFVEANTMPNTELASPKQLQDLYDAFCSEDNWKFRECMSKVRNYKCIVRGNIEDIVHMIPPSLDNGLSLLHLAAQRQSESLVRVLLEEYGANALFEDSAGHTALWHAQQNGNARIEEILKVATEFFLTFV